MCVCVCVCDQSVISAVRHTQDEQSLRESLTTAVEVLLSRELVSLKVVIE